MQKRSVDLTGQKYGKLKVLKEVEPKRFSCGRLERMWECECECGNIVIFSQPNIRSGNSRSCGCSKIIDLTGQRFRKLTVIKKDVAIQKEKRKVYKWICQCDCGNTVSVLQHSLLSGGTRSCGCLVKNKKYGEIGKHKLKDIWHNMIERCQNSNHKSFYAYGGRGIKVCPEWLDKNKGYMQFYEWSFKNGYKDGLTLDRIDVDGDYSPANCRWITNREQQRNKRNNHLLEYNGETRCISEWAEIYHLRSDTLRYRITHGWDIETALKTPSNKASD